MKVNVIQSKNKVIAHVGLSAKKYITGVLVKMIIYAIIVLVIVSVTRHVNLMNI